MEIHLLKPREVDVMLRYPAGRSLRLAKANKIPCVHLPDGEVRFDEVVIKQLLKQPPKQNNSLKQKLGAHYG